MGLQLAGQLTACNTDNTSRYIVLRYGTSCVVVNGKGKRRRTRSRTAPHVLLRDGSLDPVRLLLRNICNRLLRLVLLTSFGIKKMTREDIY